ncbi:MAG TPA: 9-O-acetylesterase, partial [Bifidobacterium sp.]|nr:9-O-acetylesterase [Bifidobacterium sp.]
DCALHNVYGMEDAPVRGPKLLGFRVGERGRVRLMFRHAHGLHFAGTTPGSQDDDLPSLVRMPDRSGFELAGADGVFHSATAAIFVDCDIDDFGDSKVSVVDYNATEFGIPINSRSIGTITLATPEVPDPVTLRYAWRSWGPAPLFNDEHLPAPPFRLDLTERDED